MLGFDVRVHLLTTRFTYPLRWLPLAHLQHAGNPIHWWSSHSHAYSDGYPIHISMRWLPHSHQHTIQSTTFFGSSNHWTPCLQAGEQMASLHRSCALVKDLIHKVNTREIEVVTQVESPLTPPYTSPSPHALTHSHTHILNHTHLILNLSHTHTHTHNQVGKHFDRLVEAVDKRRSQLLDEVTCALTLTITHSHTHTHTLTHTHTHTHVKCSTQRQWSMFNDQDHVHTHVYA